MDFYFQELSTITFNFIGRSTGCFSTSLALVLFCQNIFLELTKMHFKYNLRYYTPYLVNPILLAHDIGKDAYNEVPGTADFASLKL